MTLSLSFVSCSHEVGEYDASTDMQQRYEDAFIELFGQPDPEQNWGFGPKTTTKARTRKENADANLWGDPNADGGIWNYKVPPALTAEQKAVVRKYFQTVRNPRYQDPEWSEYFMQQVYKGHTVGEIGPYSAEEYQSADKNKIIGSDKMNHLVAIFPNGTLDHINNFNFGTCSTNNEVLNTGASTNSHNADDWHSDEIMLMQNSTTNKFGYYNSDASLYRDNYTGLVGFQTIIDALGAEANCLNDGWNRSFMGFDFEQQISGEILTNTQATWGDIPGWSYNYAWEQDANGNDVFTQLNHASTDAIVPNGLYYLNSDMNMYCGDLINITDDSAFYIYKDIDDQHKNEKCLNMKYINGLISDGYLPVSGGSFKKWVKVGGCADGYYSDWIVCLTKAEKNGQQTEPDPNFIPDIRIIAEDLTFSETVDGRVVKSDFDFNDVVFDVMFNDDGTAWVQLIAAGGTLPLVIGGTDDLTGKEVHDLFGVQRNKMVNTNAKTGISKPYPKPFKVSGTSNAEGGDWGTNIPVYVQKRGVWTEITADKGKPASKVGVDPDFTYCDERVAIEDNYPEFPNWVKDPSVIWF